VIPRARVFTILLIVFQVMVAFSLLSRGGFVGLGLFAGAVFCFFAALVSSTGGAIANLILAGMQILLILNR
jgi:hypothetical protein